MSCPNRLLRKIANKATWAKAQISFLGSNPILKYGVNKYKTAWALAPKGIFRRGLMYSANSALKVTAGFFCFYIFEMKKETLRGLIDKGASIIEEQCIDHQNENGGSESNTSQPNGSNTDGGNTGATEDNCGND